MSSTNGQQIEVEGYDSNLGHHYGPGRFLVIGGRALPVAFPGAVQQTAARQYAAGRTPRLAVTVVGDVEVRLSERQPGRLVAYLPGTGVELCYVDAE